MRGAVRWNSADPPGEWVRTAQLVATATLLNADVVGSDRGAFERLGVSALRLIHPLPPNQTCLATCRMRLRTTAMSQTSAVHPVRETCSNALVDLESAWSNYLVWLTFAVPGMLHRGNIVAMAYALRHAPSKLPIVEIGSFCGLSTCVLAYLKQKHAASGPLFTSDAWM